MMWTRTMFVALVVAWGLAAPGGQARAQQQASADARGTASLAGRVVDAADEAGLEGADVALIPVEPGLEAHRLDEARIERPVVARQETDARGRYRFDDVRPGSYLVRVTRLGYRSVTVGVQAAEGDGSAVSVALQMEPIHLEPLTVRTRGEVTVRDADGGTRSLGRIEAERLRQEDHLASDARYVTGPDLREAATLGEMDVFRTIQRMPGVTTRDDYSAELWTRGASWGETRVYLDGLPLFNPVHGLGAFSGVSHRGLSGALFHPGARPVRLPEGGAAVLDLVSGSGAGTGSWAGGGDLSLASAHGWARAPLQDGAGGWSVTARRSYADVVARSVSDAPDDQLPYVFSDVLGRLDLEVGDDVSLEVIGLLETDAMSDEIPDVLHGTTARWGNVAGQASLTWPVGDLRVRQVVGATGYGARVRAIPTRFDGGLNAPSEPPARHDFLYGVIRGEAAVPGGSWRMGYDLVHQSARYDGPQPWPYSRRPPELAEVQQEASLTRFGVWGERRWSVGGSLDVEAALRADGGSPTAAGRFELQPSLTARLTVAPGATVSVGAGRYVQYAQSPAPVGPRIERSLQTGRLWMLADEGRPPLVARLLTLGGEVWLGEAWLLSATGYLRDTDGLVLPDPTEGLLVQRPALVVGRATASGLDVGLRRLSGRITGSLGYSFGRARAEAVGKTFPAPTDRRHSLDATARVRVASWMDATVAYTLATGSPYARTLERCLGGEDDCRRAAHLDDPFGRRGPTYRSLDLVLNWTKAFDGWSLGFFLQGRNLLGHDNAVTYRDSSALCPGTFSPDLDGECEDGSTPTVRDDFTPGVPTLPLIGLSVVF